MSDPINELMEEHRLIEEVLVAGRRFAAGLTGQTESERRLLADFVRFFRGFADRHHHGKEEDLLFVAMADRGFAVASGPVAVMRHEHEMGRALVARLDAAASRPGALGAEEIDAVRAALESYADLLSAHIRKEDGMLYPMARQALPATDMAAMADSFLRFAADAGDAGRELVALGRRLAAIANPTPGTDDTDGTGATSFSGGRS